MSKSGRSWIVGSCAVAWLLACGSEDSVPAAPNAGDAGVPDGRAPGDPPLPGGDGGAAGAIVDRSSFERRYCELVEQCCAAVGTSHLTPGGCFDLLLLHSNNKKTGFQLTYAVSCIADLERAVSEPAFCSGFLRPESCWTVFVEEATGTTPRGGACATVADCAPEAGGTVTCGLFGGPKTCQFRAHGKLGDTCFGDIHGGGQVGLSGGDPTQAGCHLAEGLFCDPATRTCAALRKVGEPCLGESRAATSDGYARHRWPCVVGATCDTRTNTCAARQPAGESCDPMQLATCLDSAWCDPATSRCVRKSDAAATCTSKRECISDVCQSGQCGRGVNDTGCVAR
jgi:hypothetical protein